MLTLSLATCKKQIKTKLPIATEKKKKDLCKDISRNQKRDEKFLVIKNCDMQFFNSLPFFSSLSLKKGRYHLYIDIIFLKMIHFPSFTKTMLRLVWVGDLDKTLELLILKKPFFSVIHLSSERRC